MGTVVSFDVPAWTAGDDALSASPGGHSVPWGHPRPRWPQAPPLDEAVRWLHWVDATFSTYRDDSDVSRFGRGSLPLAQAAPELAEVLAACRAVSELSGG